MKIGTSRSKMSLYGRDDVLVAHAGQHDEAVGLQRRFVGLQAKGGGRVLVVRHLVEVQRQRIRGDARLGVDLDRLIVAAEASAGASTCFWGASFSSAASASPREPLTVPKPLLSDTTPLRTPT